MLTLNTYLEDPCRRCSIPYWKFRRIDLPESVRIVHGDGFRPEDFPGYRDTPYFRLLHRLENIPEVSLPDIELVTPAAEDIPAIADVINRSYTDLSVTEGQVQGFTRSPAYCSDLWVLAVHVPTKEIVGCGIAEFDRGSGEGSLEWIQVLPQWRRRGVGRLVVSELLRRMQGLARFATVSGKCDSPDCPELLYRACGFTGNNVWHILNQ